MDGALLSKFKKHLKDDHSHFQITLGLSAIAVFLITASLAPFVSERLGLLSLKKAGQQTFAQTCPVANITVTYPFGIPDSAYVLGFHPGVDLGGMQSVCAVASGCVDEANYTDALGFFVVIRGYDGYYYRYLHFADNPTVSKGSLVNTGDNLGLSDSTGFSTGHHLHLDVSLGNFAGTLFDPGRIIQGIPLSPYAESLGAGGYKLYPWANGQPGCALDPNHSPDPTPPSNSAPVLNPIGNKDVIATTSLSFDVTASDLDGDQITFGVLQALPTGATYDFKTFSWTPTSNQLGQYQVTFYATDGTLRDEETITILVLDPNSDYDKDGFTNLAESKIGTDPGIACDPSYNGSASDSWPLDLNTQNGFNYVNVSDLATFTVPIRKIGTKAGDTNYHRRWDLNTDGKIDIQDMAKLTTGTSGYPPMFGGTRAFNGPTCGTVNATPASGTSREAGYSRMEHGY